jgi:hypothetical protein
MLCQRTIASRTEPLTAPLGLALDEIFFVTLFLHTRIITAYLGSLPFLLGFGGIVIIRTRHIPNPLLLLTIILGFICSIFLFLAVFEESIAKNAA